VNLLNEVRFTFDPTLCHFATKILVFPIRLRIVGQVRNLLNLSPFQARISPFFCHIRQFVLISLGCSISCVLDFPNSFFADSNLGSAPTPETAQNDRDNDEHASQSNQLDKSNLIDFRCVCGRLVYSVVSNQAVWFADLGRMFRLSICSLNYFKLRCLDLVSARIHANAEQSKRKLAVPMALASDLWFTHVLNHSRVTSI
jgi:hypothetical protein